MSIRIRNDNYWKKRSMQRLVDAEKNSLPYLRQIKKLYRNSAKETVETVRSLYKTYYKGKDGFDIKALEKIANTGDLKRFKAELKREGLSTYLPEHYRGRLDRAELLNAKLWTECKKIAFQEQQISTESYNKTFKDTYDKTIYDISKGINKNIAFSEIPQKTIDEILNAKFYGENYSQRVWHNTGKLTNKLQEIIGQSILTGQSQSKTIRQIMEAYGTRGKAKGGYYDAERLIRTETNYFENRAEILSYEEIGIKKFKYLAVLDNRTSEICQEMDGKIFDVKDAVQGENTPPLHPNCRSTIVPYISEEYEPKTRIARDSETGKNYYIENMNYKEWKETYLNNPNIVVNDNNNNQSKQTKDTTKTRKTSVKNNNKEKEENNIFSIDSLPKAFRENKEIENSQNIIDKLNNIGSLNKDSTEIFNKLKNFDDDTLTIKHTKRGFYREFDNTISFPKLTGKDTNGQLNTTLHEMTHYIDHRISLDSKAYSSHFKPLQDYFKKQTPNFGDEISELFNKFNDGYKIIRQETQDKYKNLFVNVNDKYTQNKITYKSYRSEYNKIKNLINEEASYRARNYMGGGIDLMQDIYDALSGGYYSKDGIIRFGHGRNYFRSYEKRTAEIIANYNALSMTRTDLIDILRNDKPELCGILDDLLSNINKEMTK